MEILKRWAPPIGIGLLALFLAYVLFAAPSQAADLGGDCCADLEERIAELEATTARKGNRKVRVEVAGQINTALLYTDTEGYSNTTVQQNGNEESYVGFYVAARINGDLTAGATLEIDARDLGVLGLPVGGLDTSIRQQNVWIKSETLGKLTVGRAAQATKNFDEIRTDNGAVANKAFSLGALSDAYLTGIDIPIDGQFRDVVRYDSPNLLGIDGLKLVATWANSFDATKADGDGDTYDVALRYSGETGDFKVKGGLGYRSGTDYDVNLLNITSLSIPTGDVKTWMAAASVMHVGTGLFLNANYADQDWETAGLTLKGTALSGGIERKWFSVGATTLYAEWSRLTLDDGGSEGDLNTYGVGVVQALDAAAMDVYFSYRLMDLEDFGADDITAVTAGARIMF